MSDGVGAAEPTERAVDPAAVQRAIERAHAAMRARQQGDGGWSGRTEAGCFGTALHLTYARYLGALEPREAREGERFLRAWQREDGGVPQWRDAPSSAPDATALWLAGMRSAGVGDDDPQVRRARAWLAARGGFAVANLVSRAALAVAGLLDAKALPALPLGFELVPGIDGLLATVLGLNTLVPLHYLPGLLYGLRHGAPSPWCDPVSALAARRVIAYFTARRDPASGGWIGVPFVTLAVASCLVALGVSRRDPRVTEALAYVRTTLRFEPEGLDAQVFVSSLWDTAQWVRALLATGVAPTDPAVTRAAGYLARHQTTRPSPRDWQTPPPGAPAAGGWPFEPGNELNPDIDSSQEVLGALALVARGLRERGAPDAALDGVVARGRAWLLAMQNPDGGFAAFSYGKPSQQPGALFLPRAAPPPGVGWYARAAGAAGALAATVVQLGDPSTADVTARTLWTLGALGLPATHPAIERARAFLRWQRDAHTGLFWGWWAVNYLPTAAYAVTGFLASGGDASEPWVAQVCELLRERQNHDGGWGDTTASYEAPWRTGRAPSMRSLTGFVVWALCAAGHARSAAVARGVAYLLGTQRDDGQWHDAAPQGVLLPGFGYYTNDTFSTYTALEALGAWLHASRAPAEAPQE